LGHMQLAMVVFLLVSTKQHGTRDPSNGVYSIQISKMYPFAPGLGCHWAPLCVWISGIPVKAYTESRTTNKLHWMEGVQYVLCFSPLLLYLKVSCIVF
jgi:hypothetical protein